MLETDFLAAEYAAAESYAAHVASGTPEQQRRWREVYDAARLSAAQRELAAGFTRPMKLLVLSGVWCGDCIQQVPLIQRIVEACPRRLELRLADRDRRPLLAAALRLNQGGRVPVVVMMAEDFAFCSLYGDRTLTRYRALARRQLGDACPLALAAPEDEELSGTLADWLREIERVQLMLRLSPRLRQKYGD
jgi:hypothetical protein